MEETFKTTNCLGYSLFSDNLDGINFQDKMLISTVNQYSYCIAEEDVSFKQALQNSEILLPDGIGMVWAARFLERKKVKKIAGADIHSFLLKKLDEQHGSCFYLGASNATLEIIRTKVNKNFPNVRVGSYSPPFKPEFSQEDSKLMISKVNSFGPDVLFVGMTAPKQEKWSYQFKKELNTKLICSIGAVFDFYAGTVERPSKKWRDLGLEWLGRLFKEPKRMWKRYVLYGFKFGFILLAEKFKNNRSVNSSYSGAYAEDKM